MTESDHADLLHVLANITGTFQLSGYASPTYLAWEARYGFRRVEFDLPNNASGKKHKDRKTECLWMNYDPTA